MTTPGKSLTERTIKGGFWVFSLRIVERLFELVRMIVLAQLLSPNDFGLFGIALLTLSTLDTFSEAGFGQALIQKKEETKSYLNTAWTVGIVRGLLIAVILFFVAPYAAAFFKTPAAEPILKVIGLAIIFQSLTNIAVIYFEKELKFHKYFAYQFAGTIADVTVAITAALLLRSVWALVFGLLAGNLVRCIVSYIIDSHRPRLQFNKGQAKELFGFGGWILGSSILMFFITQGDDIFVGKLLGVTALGFYQMAYRISNIPATEITHVISQVTFPAYSKLQDNISKLREAYLKVLQVTAFLSFPIAGLIFVLAPDFTRIFLGEKWMPMVPAMQVLCIFGATRSMGATMGPILYSVGKPKIQVKLSAIQLIAMVMIIYPLTIQLNILGASLAVVIPNILALILIIKEVKNVIEFKYKDFLRLIMIPTTGVCLMLFVIFLSQKFLLSGNNVLSFSLLVLLGGIIYLGLIYTWDRTTEYKIRDMIGQVFSNLGLVKHD